MAKAATADGQMAIWNPPCTPVSGRQFVKLISPFGMAHTFCNVKIDI